MGHRLSRIYTRTGDNGTTGLGNGKRVAKDCARIEAYGTVDELNSAIGVVLAIKTISKSVRTILVQIQHDLFDLGAELSVPGYQVITDEHIALLEKSIDQFNLELPYLKEFILPGGSPGAATCHLARTICRRAERRVISLQRQDFINPLALTYLNRLSDLLFVLARAIIHSKEIPSDKKHKKSI